MFIDRRIFQQFDILLLGLTVAIPLLGLGVLFSAGYDPDYTWKPLEVLPDIPSQAFVRQSAFLGMGLVALLGGALVPPSWLSKLAYPVFGVCVVLLVAVDLFGSIRNGSQRWLDLGFVTIQPAEPTKLAVIVALARFLSRHLPKQGFYTFRELVLPSLFFVVPAALIMYQPDLGTALVIMAVGSGMVLFVGVRRNVLIICAVLVIAAPVLAWNKLHDYQKRRIQVLWDPGMDPKGSGYHISQSKIAVGSGALLGKGYLQGTQAHLEFLPEHTTDFIFSVLAEEWGFVGALFVILLYLAFLLRLLQLVNRSKEMFPALVGIGVGTLLCFHTVVNIGMVIGMLPVVGIPLPLFSYGGSSMISCMGAIGIVLGFDMRRLLFSGRV